MAAKRSITQHEVNMALGVYAERIGRPDPYSFAFRDKVRQDIISGERSEFLDKIRKILVSEIPRPDYTKWPKPAAEKNSIVIDSAMETVILRYAERHPSCGAKEIAIALCLEDHIYKIARVLTDLRDRGLLIGELRGGRNRYRRSSA